MRYPYTERLQRRGRVGETYLLHLERLVRLPAFESARTVLLTGSVSRGEQSFLEHEGQLEILSDIEMLAVFPDPVSAPVLAKLRHEISKEERRWHQRGPLFHLDVAAIPVGALARLPRSLFAFETRELSLVVRGPDLRRRIPEVSASDVDLGAINELILMRLWALLLGMPRSLVESSPGDLERLVGTFVLCRAALEIPTILLPNLGILRGGYEARIRALEAALRRPTVTRFFDDGFQDFMVTAWNAKLRPESLLEATIPDMYRRTLAGYFNLISYLAGESIAPHDADWDERLLRSQFRLRDERSFRRGAHELLQALALARRHRWRAAARWAASPRRRLAICCLLHGHLALLSRFEKQPERARFHQARAESLIAAVWPEAGCAPPGADFPRRWLYLREEFIPFMTHFYRFNREKSGYFGRLHSWVDESAS